MEQRLRAQGNSVREPKRRCRGCVVGPRGEAMHGAGCPNETGKARRGPARDGARTTHEGGAGFRGTPWGAFLGLMVMDAVRRARGGRRKGGGEPKAEGKGQ